MAADVATFNAAGIPGLEISRLCTDLGVSYRRYNKLPNIKNQTELQIKYAKSIMDILAIIERQCMGNYFRVHSAHRHDVIPDGTVRLEADIGTHGIKWNRATAIENLATDKMHPTIFKHVEKDWVPVEFAEGPLPLAASDIPAGFLAEAAALLTDNGLNDLLVLEIGDFAKDSGKTAEIEIHWGITEAFTILIPLYLLVGKSFRDLVPTGWNVKVNSIGPGPDPSDPDGEPTPGTHWAPVTNPKNTHKVFVDSTEALTPELLLKKLTEMNFIVV